MNMAADNQSEMVEVKMEIDDDLTEEEDFPRPSVSQSQQHSSGTSDWSEKNTISRSETGSVRNPPSAAATKSASDCQPASGRRGIKTEPLEHSETDGEPLEHSEANGEPLEHSETDGEPLEHSETDGVFHRFQSAQKDRKGKVDVVKHEPGVQDNFLFPRSLSIRSVQSRARKVDKNGLKCGVSCDSSSVDVSSSSSPQAPVHNAELNFSTVNPWSIRGQGSEPAFIRKKETPQLSSTTRTSLLKSANISSVPKSAKTTDAKKSANTSGAQTKDLKQQYNSAAFPLVRILKQHMASVHGQKREEPEDDLPVFFSSGGRGVGNSGVRKKQGGRKHVKKGKDRPSSNDQPDDTQTNGAGDQEKEKRQHVCDVCSKAFGRAFDLKRHKTTHSDLKQFECGVCLKAFGQASTLKRHKLIHAGEKKYVCDVCGKDFILADHLKRHQLIHADRKQYVCDICSKAFNEPGALKRHKFVHVGRKQYVCDVCSRSFSQLGTLKAHQAVHTGDSQFACDICHKTFAEASYLKKHNLIHTGEKKFVCDVCHRAFTWSGDLKKHKLIHTGHKQFVCGQCGKAFYRSDNLATHNRLIHAIFC